MKKPIFLWGYMGVGKTRLGKRLATKLDAQYFDLDHVIEQRMNLIVSEIFNHFGEAYFRQLERDIVKEFAEKENIVLSCGGGTPCYHQNKNIMLNSGYVVYLTVERNILLDRLWRNRTQRPLIAKMKNIEELATYVESHLAGRLPYYSQAHLSYDNTYPRTSINELSMFLDNERNR